MVDYGFVQAITQVRRVPSQYSTTKSGNTKMKPDIHMAAMAYLTFPKVSRKFTFRGFTSALHRSTETRVSVSPATRSDIPAMWFMVMNLHRTSPSTPPGCVMDPFSARPEMHHSNLNRSAKARLARRKFVVVCMQRFFFTTIKMSEFRINPMMTITANPGKRTKSRVVNFMSERYNLSDTCAVDFKQ